MPEVVPGYPDRIIPKPGHEKDLKALDATVAAAYCWEDYTPEMPDEEILARLLALNLDQSQRGVVLQTQPTPGNRKLTYDDHDVR